MPTLQTADPFVQGEETEEPSFYFVRGSLGDRLYEGVIMGEVGRISHVPPCPEVHKLATSATYTSTSERPHRFACESEPGPAGRGLS